MSGTDGLVLPIALTATSHASYWMANRLTEPCVLTGHDVFIADSGGTYAMLEVGNGSLLWATARLAREHDPGGSGQ